MRGGTFELPVFPITLQVVYVNSTFYSQLTECDLATKHVMMSFVELVLLRDVK